MAERMTGTFPQPLEAAKFYMAKKKWDANLSKLFKLWRKHLWDPQISSLRRKEQMHFKHNQQISSLHLQTHSTKAKLGL